MHWYIKTKHRSRKWRVLIKHANETYPILPYLINLTFEIRFLTFQHIHGSRLRLLTFEILTLKLNLMFSTFSGMRPEREILGNFKQLFLHFWAILGGIWAKFYLIHRVTLIWISFDFKRVAADETFGQFFPLTSTLCQWHQKDVFEEEKIALWSWQVDALKHYKAKHQTQTPPKRVITEVAFLKTVHYNICLTFCRTRLPQANTKWVWLSLSSLCPLFKPVVPSINLH